jgi:hypothetical protein
MKNTLLSLLVLAVGLFVIPRSADAHHGLAAFDSTTEVTFKGTVTDFFFGNPHCVVEFELKDDNGQVQTWKGELTSASHLAPRGWTPNTVQSDDEVTITGFRAKNGAHSVWVNKIVSNSKELKLDSEYYCLLNGRPFSRLLRFSILWEASGMAGIIRDEITFNLIENDNQGWAHNASVSIGVSNLEALYEEFRGIKARVGPLEIKAWGRREFHIIIPSGVCFQFYGRED